MSTRPQDISIADFSYHLPAERIAEFPLPQRDASRLLVYQNGLISDDQFSGISTLLPEESTLVLNNTRVIEARLLFEKPTGGVIQVFCLEPQGHRIEEAMTQTGTAVWQCLIGGASKWKPGQVLQKKIAARIDGKAVEGMLQAHYEGKAADGFLIRFTWQPEELSFVQVLNAAGAIPLPPYIRRTPGKEDADRYQTVFGRHEGSVAAPTAALHFTPEVFRVLGEKNIHPQYVTLHVGAGTFKPVKSETLGEHPMHSEPFSVTAEALEALINSEKIIAVGTTSLRTLESLHWIGLKLREKEDALPELNQWEAYELAERHPGVSYKESYGYLLESMRKQGLSQLQCRTRLIIVPGYPFQVPSGLITNFHQPQSTLILLVAAFIGEDWRKVYQHALDHEYRFLSYGDSSLLWRP